MKIKNNDRNLGIVVRTNLWARILEPGDSLEIPHEVDKIEISVLVKDPFHEK